MCVYVCADGVSVTETVSLESSTQQALQYALAGATQQVQIHRIGEDGQVQVVSVHTLTNKETHSTDACKLLWWVFETIETFMHCLSPQFLTHTLIFTGVCVCVCVCEALCCVHMRVSV